MADTITNSISITDVPSALAELVEYAKSLDLRQPQVNIKAKIILVDRSTLEGLGLRYDIGSQSQFFNDIVPRLDSLGKPLTDAGQILLGGNTISSIANASARVPGAALQLVYSTAMGNYDFTTFLEALQTNTLLDVQAEPSATCAEQSHGEPDGGHAGADPRHRRRIGDRQHEQRAARPGDDAADRCHPHRHAADHRESSGPDEGPRRELRRAVPGERRRRRVPDAEGR